MNPYLALLAAQQQGRLNNARTSRLHLDTTPSSHHHRWTFGGLLGGRHDRRTAADRQS